MSVVWFIWIPPIAHWKAWVIVWWDVLKVAESDRAPVSSVLSPPPPASSSAWTQISHHNGEGYFRDGCFLLRLCGSSSRDGSTEGSQGPSVFISVWRRGVLCSVLYNKRWLSCQNEVGPHGCSKGGTAQNFPSGLLASSLWKSPKCAPDWTWSAG